MVATEKERKYWIMARDRQILESIAIGWQMSAQALEWLHFPTWRTRWKAAQAAGKADAYRPAPHLYRRLNHLLDAEMVYRLRRPIERSVNGVFGRAPDVYCLAPAGRRLLNGFYGNGDYELEPEIPPVRKREWSFNNVSHGELIGRTYAALKAAFAERPNVDLIEWLGEHMTARDFDRVRVGIVRSDGGISSRWMGIQPDATATLRWTDAKGVVHDDLLFLEVDRGTRPKRTWAEKMQAYSDYVFSKEFKDRFGGRQMARLLVIARDEHQRQALMDVTSKVRIRWFHPNQILFGLEQDVHPDRIGGCWLRLETLHPSVQKGLEKVPLVISPYKYF